MICNIRLLQFCEILLKFTNFFGALGAIRGVVVDIKNARLN